MKKLLLSACLTFSFAAISQTVLLVEDFESGGTNFNMNTTDMGGMSGLTGDNAWVINNVYAGGSGTSSCFGFGFTIGTTPSQPAAITNGPNSSYMHILSDDGMTNGILNANYGAADGSFCFFAQSHFTAMNTDVSTIGMNTVELDFYWSCFGDVNAFGEVYYSTNSGASWTLITAPISNYFGNGNWMNQVLTDAAWDNQATLRFGYRFVNNVATGGGDPSFSIDEMIIRATPAGGGNTITTGTNLAPTSWCEGTFTTIQVDFTSTGTFNPGNVYTAELSDGTGSFAAPTSIGTLNSTANSGMILSVVPAITPAGAGYRIRVVSDSPVTIGTDNGSDLVINPNPTVTLATFSDVCTTTPPFTLTGGTPPGGTYSGPGVTAGTFDPAAAGMGTHTITYDYTDANGCSGMASQTIFVDICIGLDELDNQVVNVYPNPAENSFMIDADFIIDEVVLMDMSGRQIKSFTNESVYEIQEVPNGVYLLQISDGQYVKTIRIVIR